MFLLLAVCLIGFLAGCDGGGGGGSDDNGGNGGDNGGGNGGGATSNAYVLSNLIDDLYITGVTQVAGGIRGTLVSNGHTIEMLQTITLNPADNTFTWYIKTTDITTSSVDSNITYSGTMAVSGSNLTLTTNKSKNNDTSVETAVGPWDDPFTISDNAIVQGTETFTKQ